MRALPADSVEYFDETAGGNMMLPVATGGGAAGLAAGVAGGALASLGGGAGGALAGAGSAVASAPHCALRNSFHFMPLSVPASFAALYLALHSLLDSACAEFAASAVTPSSMAAQMVI